MRSRLTFAKGRVPMPGGFIDVEWSNTDGTFRLDVKASRVLAMEIVLPNGRVLQSESDRVSVTE